MVTAFLFGVMGVLVFLFYWARQKQMNVFRQLGIPGPPPNFLFGNLLHFVRTPVYQAYLDWQHKYGDNFGYFEGPTPILVTSDLEILKQVFLTKFNKFSTRKLFPVQVDPEKDDDVHMFFAQGERWRRLRAIINPAFSGAKLKKLSPRINAQLDVLIQQMDKLKQTGESFDIQRLYERLTLDVITNCGFGLEAEALKNPKDPFLERCRGVLESTTRFSILFLLGFTFPTLHAVWIAIYTYIGKLYGNPLFWLEDNLARVIEMRKIQQVKQRDLLQLMLDSECQTVGEARRNSHDIGLSRIPVRPYVAHDCHDEVPDSVQLMDKNLNYYAPKKPLKVLSSEEVKAQCLLFLLAGYETTSTALSYLTYELSVNQDIQRRLQHEVDDYFPAQESQPCFTTVQELPFLEMVWCETLRKYPVAANVIARQCLETCVVNGVTVYRDMLVQANVYAVHNNEEIWGENTRKFDPDRFLPERRKGRHCMAWLPFGAGYRSCIGARLAIMEAKMAMVRIMKKFTIVPTEKSQVPIKLVEGATLSPETVHVKLIERTR